MRFYLDTEFIENGPTSPLHLISLGVVCEDGREYYAEDEGCPLHLANDWVKQNVIPHLDRTKARPRIVMVEELRKFVAEGRGSPSFWGYYADYDWVAVAQLFGTMVDLPVGWPQYCLDLKQVSKMLPRVELPPQEQLEHHALNDARWNLEAWKVLNAAWHKDCGSDLP